MFKRIVVIAGILLVVFGGIYTYQVITKPYRIHRNIEQTFAHLGFKDLVLSEPAEVGRTLIYDNMDLDEDGFSTIDTLTISHSPFIISFSDDDTSATIKGLSLTGEIGQNGAITIAGFSPPDNAGLNFSRLPSVINIEDFDLSLLSEDFGGINVSGSVQVTNEEQTLKIQGKLDAIQKQASINAKIEGQYNQNGFTDLRIEIENGKFDLGHIQGTRIAGLILASGEGLSALRSVTEIQTGALRVYDLPWQNAAITIDTKTETPQAIISAKSAGYEGMELGLTIPNLFEPETFTGQIHTDTLKTALNYFGSQNVLSVEKTSLENLASLKNLSVKFAKKDRVKFQIRDDANTAALTGIIQASENGFAGEVKSTPIPLLKISDTWAGTTQINGTFKKSDAFTGDIKTEFKNAAMPYGFLKLAGISAILNITDIATLTGPATADIPCTVTGFKLDEKCSLNAAIKEGSLVLSDLKIRGPGFDAFIPQADKQKTLLQIRSLSLRETLQLFGKSSWSGQGEMDGNAVIETGQGQAQIKNMSLTNQRNGVLKITDPAFFDLLDMEELEKETMKLALENFHYDLLEIKAEGTLPDKVKISVFGKGKNPLLMQGRPFSLDFELTPDFAPILTELAKER